MSTQNGWIKTAERAPTEADCPIWCVHKGMSVFLKTADDYEEYFVRGRGPGWVTHWRPAAADIPTPPKEETQRDKDEAMFVQLHGESWQGGTMELREHHAGRRIGFFSALAYERAEVAKLLPPVRPQPEGFRACITADADSIKAIHARCAGGAK